MKTSFLPALVLVAGTLWASVSHAVPAPGRKLPGPSAVEAARLKKSPPPNYLSHYLPDDRYKIAGGVWKYVSTDLDTYYHVPTSPNMLRQPANRVIGFASARDAEEAGLVADPTDGTAAKARPQTNYGGGGEVVSGRTGDYVADITAILLASQRDEAAWLVRLRQSGVGGRVVTPATKAVFAAAVPMMRKHAAQLSAVKPPQRYARFHSLLLKSYRQGISSISRFSRGLNQGQLDLGSLDLTEMVAGQQALMQEAQRVGINPQLLR